MASGRNANRNGFTLIYSIIILLALCAMASLAVDYGRVVVAKTQLGAAADAAALASAQLVLSDTTSARSAAVTIAQANLCDGSPVQLNSTDVQFINWDASTRTYTTIAPGSGGTPNAVLVTARRNASRGNAIDLPFAKLIGANTCDINATAIAMASPNTYVAVGLDYVTMSGNASNTYRTQGHSIGSGGGNIASNGDITLSGSGLINGNAYPGVGGRVTTSGSAQVTGTTSPLTSPLNYPMPSAGNYASVNDNARIPSFALKNGSISLSGNQTAVIPGGTYYVKDFNLSGSSSCTFSGPAVIYCTGNFTLSGSTQTADNVAANLKLYMVSTNTKIDLSGSTATYVQVYAPGSQINISGSGDLYGSVIGQNLTISGSAAIHGDTSSTGSVALVK